MSKMTEAHMALNRIKDYMLSNAESRRIKTLMEEDVKTIRAALENAEKVDGVGEGVRGNPING